MAYLGQNPVPQGKDAGPAVKLDDISTNFDGSETVFNLSLIHISEPTRPY